MHKGKTGGNYMLLVQTAVLGFKTHLLGGKSCLVLETKLSQASEVIDLKKESITTILLDQDISLLHSNQYPYTHR